MDFFSWSTRSIRSRGLTPSRRIVEQCTTTSDPPRSRQSRPSDL